MHENGDRQHGQSPSVNVRGGQWEHRADKRINESEIIQEVEACQKEEIDCSPFKPTLTLTV
jgi:hypothetical protein